jgi:hypothetical protein
VRQRIGSISAHNGRPGYRVIIGVRLP